MTSIVGICTLKFYLPGVTSLKQKRSIIKPMLKRMRNTFNVSNAEIAHQDVWQSSGIAITTVSNETAQVQRVLQQVIAWIEDSFPDAVITDQSIEII